MLVGRKYPGGRAGVGAVREPPLRMLLGVAAARRALQAIDLLRADESGFYVSGNVRLGFSRRRNFGIEIIQDLEKA